MKKQIAAQILNAQIKKRQTENLTYQIEKLVNNKDFEVDEIIDIFLDCTNIRGAYITEKETLQAFNKVLTGNSTVIIDNLDLIQEHELKTFCKLKGIKYE